jgi:O-antigen/teichoic acid export membrane protein
MNSLRQALAYSFVEKYALIVLSLVSYVLLARLLTPEAIGIFSVAAALTGIVQVIREFGVGNFLIQQRELTEAHRRTALGISLLAGSALFLLFFASASAIGYFYGDARIVLLVRINALNFLILPFCSIALSLLRREMKFSRLMTVNLVAGCVGFAVTMSLALSGFGPQSLAWGTVAVNGLTAIGAWSAMSASMRPDRPALGEWRHLVKFGAQSTFAAAVTSAAMDINDLVVGKVMGFAPVAMINRAMGLMNLFHRDLMGAARNVAYPAFANAHRAQAEMESRFIASLAAVTAFGWPFYGFLALFPLETLRLMAGPQWDAAAPLVKLYAAAGMLSSTFILIPTLILAVGRVDLASRADVVVHVIRIALIVGAALIFKSLIAVALAFLLSFAIATPLFFAYKGRCVPNDLRALARQLLPSLWVTLAALALPGLFSLWYGLGRSVPIPMAGFALSCLTTMLAWVLALRVFDHPLAREALFRRLTTRLPFFA